jgi:two-component system cell cycle response regulator DivK
MDIQLPDISGIEAIRRLKADEQTRSIPIIVISAFAMSYEKAGILASGCEAYITKPFRGEELAALIHDGIGYGVAEVA